MWRGMNPTIYPNRHTPIKKKTAPVRIELIAYAVMVVEITSFGLSSPTVAMIVKALITS
jgi:hypothetical protein